MLVHIWSQTPPGQSPDWVLWGDQQAGLPGVKIPCFGKQRWGTERKPGGADLHLLQQSLVLTEGSSMAGGVRC